MAGFLYDFDKLRQNIPTSGDTSGGTSSIQYERLTVSREEPINPQFLENLIVILQEFDYRLQKLEKFIFKEKEKEELDSALEDLEISHEKMKSIISEYIENNYKRGDSIFIEDLMEALNFDYSDIYFILEELDEEGFFTEA